MATTLPYGSEGYRIRSAAEHDIPLLNSIELAAATIFPPDTIPEHILTDRVPLDMLRAAQRDNLLWVAVDAQNTPVGYLMAHIADGLALLAQLDVHPLHGRKGLGTALLHQGMAHLREKGVAACYLTTFSHVWWNAPFYAKLGFTSIPEQDLPEYIAKTLCEERARGLENRVAMRLLFSTDCGARGETHD